MTDIPTIKDAEKLRTTYVAVFGPDNFEYVHDELDWMEYRLLNDVHYKMFGHYVRNMCNTQPLEELNAEIRECVEKGIPYTRDIPDDAIFRKSASERKEIREQILQERKEVFDILAEYMRGEKIAGQDRTRS